MKKSRLQQRTRAINKRTVNFNYNEEFSSITEIEYKNQKQKRKNRQRQENSLGELTKNFIKYIKERKNKEVNINDAVKKLKVKKRRIYDITNVLEGNNTFNSFKGIGFIRKIEKTKIKWLKDELFKDDFEEPDESELLAKQQTTQLIKEHERVTKDIQQLRHNIENFLESEEFKNHGYVTFKDLITLCDEDFINLLAIHAPVGTTIEIPDPESCALVFKKTLEVRFLHNFHRR